MNSIISTLKAANLFKSVKRVSELKDLDTAGLATPSAIVVYGGDEKQERAGTKVLFAQTWYVCFVVSNAAQPELAIDKADEIASTVNELLVGKEIAAGYFDMHLTSIEPDYNDDGSAVLTLEYTVAHVV